MREVARPAAVVLRLRYSTAAAVVLSDSAGEEWLSRSKSPCDQEDDEDDERSATAGAAERSPAPECMGVMKEEGAEVEDDDDEEMDDEAEDVDDDAIGAAKKVAPLSRPMVTADRTPVVESNAATRQRQRTHENRHLRNEECTHEINTKPHLVFRCRCSP